MPRNLVCFGDIANEVELNSIDALFAYKHRSELFGIIFQKKLQLIELGVNIPRSLDGSVFYLHSSVDNS